VPSARSDAVRILSGRPASLARSLVVRNTSARGTPLSRTACPISSSFAYMVAVSMCRYPAPSASSVALQAWRPCIGQVPNPTIGMTTSPARVTAGTSCGSVIIPFSVTRPAGRVTGVLVLFIRMLTVF